MSTPVFKTLDANEAVAHVAYALNEVIAIYPITPASPMGEWADAWAAAGVKNLWDTVPSVIELQSEGGAAGAIHGALQTGALATTFTASQGLLLMIPNMYKIAGELTPAVFHIAARSLAAQALSIFGDHSDAMAARATGWAMLCSNSVQEAQDFALIAQAATLESRIPFLHFFDGFRTSHEISKIETLSHETLRAIIDDQRVLEHRARALSPDHPVLRGTAQNPDVYFQARESVNSFYAACPDIVQQSMDKFAALTGRQYRIFEYHGAPDAERVIVLMGSGGEAAHETVDYLNAQGEKVGVLKVRLYRPFDSKRFAEALPPSMKALAVLDRTKEPGSAGEPLYLDCVNAVFEHFGSSVASFPPTPALSPREKEKQTTPLEQSAAPGFVQGRETILPLHLGGGEGRGEGERAALQSTQNQNALPKIVGGRYGLSSKEFTPAMVKAVFDNLAQPSPKNHFTLGINDDVSWTSLEYDPSFTIVSNGVFRALFFGLGSDGTVGANKDSIKIIGENTDHYAQGYFVYDSKKAGAVTISHLRFGPRPIRSTYLVTQANFVGCQQPFFLERFDVLENILPGGTFLLNSPHSPEEVWEFLPETTQRQILNKRVRFYVIDAHKVARESGMGGRINTVMQVCFFSVSGVVPHDQAIAAIKDSIRKTYGKKGEEIVQMNLNAVDNTLAHLNEVTVPNRVRSRVVIRPPVPAAAPDFVRNVLGKIIAGRGDELPVSALPVDGTFPTGTARWEKRNLAQDIPVWDAEVCIQCGKCVFVCPHAVIRSKVYGPDVLAGAPNGFQACEARHPDWKGMKYTLQVAPEDCTGCGICVDVCPARNKSEARLKAINMRPQEPLREIEKINWEFFLSLPDPDRRFCSAGFQPAVSPTSSRQDAADKEAIGGLDTRDTAGWKPALRLHHSVHAIQVQQPLFEFSGACAGCGETPYLKLLTQLLGGRLIVANATGCSSIYGGNLPTTPWTTNAAGRGPAWSNSLFEDNAEFGLGFRVSLDKQKEFAAELLLRLAGEVGEELVRRILNQQQNDEADIHEQRQAVAELKRRLEKIDLPDARQLLRVADTLVKKSVWIIGGDGWAYDIGFGGLDHVLASGRNVKVLVLDTEVYSNTGGQCSKSTPRGAVAKFAAGGKPAAKKDLGLIAMTYGNVYVASVAMGAKDEHTLKAFLEAEAYDGPALIIAYSHCIAHG
ncbi:MAG TPA: 2-oxoacid:acceptor oxidoreductase family protein, partial [Candidatus Eisenbacteria bacterium]|nr:2-oxoacid:acceptor oxidoreductase family protein [Candidatus Eisenbacteria bacterium]